MTLGINLCFAVKRWLEPACWAAFVRDELELDTVQFTFDLLDPWLPEMQRSRLARKVRKAADDHGLTLHSVSAGLAGYVPGGLLDPDPDARKAAATWWSRAIDTAAALGASAVGGPLGTMSLLEAASPATAEARYQDLLDELSALGDQVRQAGLTEFLIEPTPIRREIPSAIDQCLRLTDDLTDREVFNIAFTLDIGHALNTALYGPDATVEAWLAALADQVHAVHLDNTDGIGDPHWGWPDRRGKVDVERIAGALADARLGRVPVFLEVYPRFEEDDEQVRRLIVSSVEHCRPHFGGGSR